MTRTRYLVQIIDESGTELDARVKYAMNSGIRESEALLLALARNEATHYCGDNPTREGDVYTRRWTSALGRLVTTRVARQA